MGKSKNVSKQYTTGKGELVGFISVVEPSTKFNKDGVYSANILLPKEEGEKLAALIKETRTEQFKTYGKGTKVADVTQCVPYEIVDEETGEATPDAEGRYILKTKASAFIKEGKPTFQVALFDTKGKRLVAPKVGEGTIAKVAVVLSGYSVAGKTGVSVKLKALQIIDLVEYGTGNADSYGFGEEEGYEASEEELTEEVVADEEVEEEDF